MKFMGSKRHLLRNGLSQLLADAIGDEGRFLDLFAGSGAVAAHVAQRTAVPVVAVDLQHFSSYLAGAILHRTRALDGELLFARLLEACASLGGAPWRCRTTVPDGRRDSRKFVLRERNLAASSEHWFTRAYGGYYFSHNQADALARLRSAADALPEKRRLVAMAALIRTASRICAAPGHTAQPFAAWKQGLDHIRECWDKSVLDVLRAEIVSVAGCNAVVEGTTIVGDAVTQASLAKDGDVVFLDPPYSGVHYSRFYHVLESLARGTCSDVSGAGRYPPAEERPKSDFSMKSTSKEALTKLLTRLSQRDVTVLLTYPEGKCSNGLYGKDIVCLAMELFSSVAVSRKKSRFSTLGGNGDKRLARQRASELIITMRQS